MLTVGSLFSGIGGLDLGLERAGMQVRWQCEIDPYCRAVLSHHWPGVPCYSDIRDIDATAERVDLICGGFPCQPVSAAGKQLAQKDPRWLWPEFARVVGVLRPRYVVVENVIGLRKRGLEDVIGDLASLGYDAWWQPISAASVGASHIRRRFFIVANSDGSGLQGLHEERGREHLQSTAEALRGSWTPEPFMARVADGIPRRMVLEPIRALGNAVVPQVAEAVGRMILEQEVAA